MDKKKNILITGANRGIGFETARQLALLGHHIILSGRSESKVNAAVEKLKKEAGEAEGLVMDISDTGSVVHAAHDFAERDQKLDVLINNAGILLHSDKSLLDSDEEILPESIKTNSLGVVRIVRAFLVFMNRPSRIINISSGGGSMTDPVGGWSPAYCVSKTTENAITRHLAFELQPVNISVNAICPGWVETDMGGKGATRAVGKGAETQVWLAIEVKQAVTGKIFRDKKEIPW